MKFSGKIRFKIILKVTKNQGSTLSIEETFFKKPQAPPLSPFPPGRLGLNVMQLNTAICRKSHINVKRGISSKDGRHATRNFSG